MASFPTTSVLGGEDRAFRQLSETERLAHLSAVIDCSHDGIFSTDMKLRVLSWNLAAEQIYGHSPEEMIGQSVMRLLPKGREHELEDVLKKFATGHTVPSYETKRLRKNGELFDVFLTVSPVRDHDGNMIGMSVIARDITK